MARLQLREQPSRQCCPGMYMGHRASRAIVGARQQLKAAAGSVPVCTRHDLLAGPTLSLRVPEHRAAQHATDGQDALRAMGSCVLVRDPLGIPAAAVLDSGSILPVAAFSSTAALISHRAPCMPEDAEDTAADGLGDVTACLLPCGQVAPLDACQQHCLAARAGGEGGLPRPGSAAAQACCARIIHRNGSPIAAAVLDSGTRPRFLR